MTNKELVKQFYSDAHITIRTVPNLRFINKKRTDQYIWHHDSEPEPVTKNITYFMVYTFKLSRDVIAASYFSPQHAWKYAAERVQQDILDKLSN